VVPIEQERAVRLAQDAHAWSGVQCPVAIEGGEDRQCRDAVAGVPAKLRVHEEPAEGLGFAGGEPEALKGQGEATPQVIDPHTPRALTPVFGHESRPTSDGVDARCGH
jgi:hypothetical protein